jgi:hypothetical protein
LEKVNHSTSRTATDFFNSLLVAFDPFILQRAVDPESLADIPARH